MKQPGCSIAILLLVVPPLLVPFILEMPMNGTRDNIMVTVAIVYLMLSIPVSIVVFLDWFRSPARGGLDRGMRNVARVPVFVFGLIAVLIGGGVLAWVAYNLLIARQPQFRWSGLRLVGAMVSILIFGIHLIRVSFRDQESDQPTVQR